MQPDHQTAIVVLTHDDKFDEPALIGALETDAFYIGALGSRRNQERRRERLLEAGVPEEALDRIKRPVRPRHRRRHAGGDGALDHVRDPRGARAARGRLPEGREEAHPRRGRIAIARVAWLSLAPVKSLRLTSVDAIELELTGVRGDRRYYLVDDEGALLNAKRVPSLLAVRAEPDDGRLLLRFPDGPEVDG